MDPLSPPPAAPTPSYTPFPPNPISGSPSAPPLGPPPALHVCSTSCPPSPTALALSSPPLTLSSTAAPTPQPILTLLRLLSDSSPPLIFTTTKNPLSLRSKRPRLRPSGSGARLSESTFLTLKTLYRQVYNTRETMTRLGNWERTSV